MGFEGFEPIFGEPKAEWAKNSDSGSFPLSRFLMHVFARDYYQLKFHVTDFHTNTFEAVKSVMQLEDMRDSIGIGGSWSEFVEYFVASIKSEGVKLLLEKHSDSDGATHARLVAQKSKGMPLVSISLTKIVDSAACDAMENMSFGLFRALKCIQNLAVEEKDHSLQLTNMMSKEKDRCVDIQNELQKRQKLEKMNFSDKADVSSSLASNGSQDSPEKRATQHLASKKVTNRVVPVFRRAKVRGISLQDTEDDKDT